MDPLKEAGEHPDRLAEYEDRLRALEREYQTQRHELRTAYQDIHILKALQDVALELASILDPEPLLRRIVRSAMELMQAQGSSLLTLDKDKNALVFEVVDGEVSQQLVGRWLKVGEGVAGWVAQTGEPVLIKDAQNDPRFAPSFDSSTGFRTETMICSPLIARDQLLGVLSVVNKTSPGGFEPKDLAWLNALASLAAVAIENVNLYQRLRQERDRVVIAQEEVRKQLARDLHDGPTQTVAHVIMQANFIKKLLQHEPAKIPEELDELSEIAQGAIRQMRTMLFDLRPLILETQGLPAALRLYAERHQVEGVTQINLYVDDNLDRYDPRIESAAFSIVQEAVNNALKHAQARNIWLRMSKKGDTLVVEVEDDGVGFDMESVLHAYENRGSLGMISMQERAELIGGNLTLVSAANQGTTVMLRVPVGTDLTKGD